MLVVQRLEREKDTATAVKAWHRATLRHEGWTLQVLGAGAERGALEWLVRDLDLTASVELLGSVDDVAARLGTASLLLATAPAEPFGLAVVEAMAAGLPVLAADGGAHRETIGPASPGTLFAPGDASAAARILDELGADAERRATLAAAGRARFEARVHHREARRPARGALRGARPVAGRSLGGRLLRTLPRGSRHASRTMVARLSGGPST